MCSFSKTTKKLILTVRYKITQQLASKDYIKTSPTYFSQFFLQNISSRPYPNVKTILDHFEFWILF